MDAQPAVLLAYVVLLGALGIIGAAYGHGTGSETLPPMEMDGELVTLVVSSSQEEGMVRVDIAMVRHITEEAVPNADFRITARHGQTQIFSQEFHRGDGRIIFDLADGIEYTPPESSGGGFFGILGPGSFKVSGPGLAGGGLYSFDVSVLSADGYEPADPPLFESAVSVPITYDDVVDGGRWGDQPMHFITYYDTLHGRGYDPETGRVFFEMPFQWDAAVIEQIETVHVEFTIPNGFGDMLAASMDAYVNGIPTPPRTVAIDDYFMDTRTVHIVLPRYLLLEMLGAAGGDSMEFDIGAAPRTPHSAVTSNGEYRVLVDTGPSGLAAGREAAVSFNITNVFLRSMNVEADYTATVTRGGALLHSQSGVSNGEVTMRFPIPGDASGPALISFQDINGNDLADAALPVFIDPAPPEVPQTPAVPPWIRDTVQLWTSGDIDDGAFAAAISYLIQQDIIRMDAMPQAGGDGGPIDDWVRTTAGWWVDGLVSDAEFLAGLEYLVGRGVIAVAP